MDTLETQQTLAGIKKANDGIDIIIPLLREILSLLKEKIE